MTTQCPCPGHTWAMLLFKRPEAQPTGLQSQECATSSLKLAMPIHHSWVGPLYFKVCGSKLLKRYNCWPVSRAKSVSIPPSLSNGQLVSTDFHAYSACYLGSKYTASKINPGDTAMTTYHTGRTDKERWRKDILFYHPYTLTHRDKSGKNWQKSWYQNVLIFWESYTELTAETLPSNVTLLFTFLWKCYILLE